MEEAAGLKGARPDPDDASPGPLGPRAGGTRELLTLALPLVVSQSFMTVQVFVDTILLAWHDPREMAAALPARHRLTRRPHLTLKDLAAETFILYRRPDGRGLYDVIIAACAEAGFSPHVGQEAPRIVSTLNLVAAGLGVTIVPASLSRLPLDGVSYRPLKGRPALKVPLSLACRADERSAATLGFIELVRRLGEA